MSRNSEIEKDCQTSGEINWQPGWYAMQRLYDFEDHDTLVKIYKVNDDTVITSPDFNRFDPMRKFTVTVDDITLPRICDIEVDNIYGLEGVFAFEDFMNNHMYIGGVESSTGMIMVEDRLMTEHDDESITRKLLFALGVPIIPDAEAAEMDLYP